MMQKIVSFFVELLQVVVFAVSIFLFIYLLIIQPHKIKGDSMEPNFHTNEYLLTDKLSYRFGLPQKGDVVVFKAPPTYKDEFIKRVVGVPGDKVSVSAGKVYVNDQLFEESYIPDTTQTFGGQFLTEGKTVTVPEKSYFVMGDNREHSLDSRMLGFIPFDKITGRAWFVYWPIKNAGVIKNAFAK